MTIELVGRDIIFKQNTYLARHLYDWQQSMFDPSVDVYEAGEEVWLDIDADEPVVLSEEQADVLNKDNEENCLAMIDPLESPPPDIPRPESCIAETEATSFDQFLELIGPAFIKLSEVMDWKEIHFITAYRDAYLTQKNDYPPAERAAEELKKLGIGDDYAGGVIAKRNETFMVLGPFFTLQRYNASAPYVNFAAAGFSVVGTLCKYGNIHFDCYEAHEFILLKEALLQSGFTVPVDGICEDKFSHSDLCEGRRIALD